MESLEILTARTRMKSMHSKMDEFGFIHEEEYKNDIVNNPKMLKKVNARI